MTDEPTYTLIEPTLPLTVDELKHRGKPERVVGGLRYSITKASLIVAVRPLSAGDFWRYLFRTPSGRFFLLAQRYNYPFSEHASDYRQHTGEIEPIDQEYAAQIWQRSEYAERLPFEVAFPDYGVQDA